MKGLQIGLLVAGLAAAAAAHDRKGMGDGNGVSGISGTRPTHKTKELKLLKPGAYTARVKALPCSACGAKVLETMKAFPGVADASVDQEKSVLRFTVRPGATIRVAALQRKLKGISDKMGMGADYSLREIRPAPSRAG